jgi:outer membrane protein assembly factor BamB
MKPTFIALLALCLPVAGADKKKPGTVLWKFETEDRGHSSPAIGSDGTVYVGSSANKLYAIKTDSHGLAKSPWPMRGQNARHTGRVMKKK